MIHIRRQQGFSLVLAIFILVVLSLMSLYMVRILGTQTSTMLYSLQGTRAYNAAKSGIEWGITKVSTDKNCLATDGVNLTFPAINSFTVDLSCVSLGTYQEEISRSVFKITSSATFASFDSPDHAFRKLEITLILDD